MRGRKPKPTALHRLQGTHNPTRHGRDRAREPIAEGDIEEPPIDLTDSQAELWRECLANMPPGVLKRIDKKVLAVFVEAADRHNIARNMQAILDSDPGLKLLAKGPNGTLVPSPYNAIMKETGDMILKCADRLGFCPTARPRIKLDDAAVSDKLDAWAPLRLKMLPGGRTD